MTSARAAAEKIRARRTQAITPSRDPRELLSRKQLDVWACSARLIKLLCGRRAGKTFWACVWLLVGAQLKPGSLSVYIALTRSSAELISWATFKLVASALGIDASCFNDSRLRITLPNGSLLIVTGSDDRKTIETWRGVAIWRAVVDEMGSQMPETIAYFVGSILWPATADLRGSIALLGTPGLVCEGYWWDLTRPERLVDDPAAFAWTLHDNPFFADRAEQEMLETLALVYGLHEVVGFDAAGDAIDAAGEVVPFPLQFRREYLAEWTQDAGALVYPFDVSRNGILELPTTSSTGAPIPAGSWRYVLGVDVGVVDECAWVTWAWNPAWRGAIATFSAIEQLDPDPAAVRTQQIFEDTSALGPASVDLVVDCGGMGKAHERIMRSKYGLPVLRADKEGKASAIRELRGDLLSGAAKILAGPALNPLRAQYAVLGWCEKKLVHSPRQPDHLADAGLYAYRRVRHYRPKPEAHRQPPPLASAERFVYEEEKRLRARAEEARRREGRGRLDR